MDETQQEDGRIARIAFEKKERLPHFFRLMATAMRLYRQHALSYVVLALIPYILIRLVAFGLSQNLVSYSSAVLVVFSVVVQIIAILSIIDYARKGDTATVSGAIFAALLNIHKAALLALTVSLVVFGVVSLFVLPLVFALGTSYADLLMDIRVQSVVLFLSAIVISSIFLSPYALHYENIGSVFSLVRSIAYDRVSRFAVLGRILSLLLFGLAVVLLLVYLGALLLRVGLIESSVLGWLDELVVVFLLPLFVLYGSSLYEVTKARLTQVQVDSSDKWAVGLLSFFGFIAGLFLLL
jgi:hypothetical protein